jgi:predicted DsbA family dithiol-disulfide isomerase/predicted GNAT family acetyltransferase
MMESDGISHDVLGKRFVGKTNRGDEYYLEYNIFEGKVLDAHHTFVPVNGRGKRLAEKLTFACFEFAKKEQLLVQPSCSYISSTFLKKYPDFLKFTPRGAQRTQTATIEMVSDTMCPWCFIGKRKLDAAVRVLTAAGVANVQTRFHPWLLRPKLALNKTKFVNKKRSYLRLFKGSMERFDRMVQELSAIGRGNEVGIEFKFEGDIGTTIDAAQLIYWTGAEFSLNQQSLLVDQLFSAYHEQGKNVALPSVLMECVSNVPGLPVATAQKVIEEDRYRKAVAVSAPIRPNPPLLR